MIRKTPPRNLLTVCTLGAAVIAATACASTTRVDEHVTREPLPYNNLARSPVVRNAPRQASTPFVAPTPAAAPVAAFARPSAARPTYSPTPRSIPAVAAPPTTRPAPQVVARAPEPVVDRRPVTVPVAMNHVSAPASPVVTRSSVVPAPRVSGTLRDAALLPQFEAHERWVADELTALSTERRALQGLISAHSGYDSDPSPANRERITQRVEDLRQVARIARSIDTGSSRAEIQAADSEVSAQAQDLTERRRDVTRVIIAIESYRSDGSADAQAALLRALERYTEGSR